ncbi:MULTISPECIES: hypothetical protein [Streptomyces]|uniref:hypothetical protein n=1 Tax=Streptomyces TaxID=1883 RepID=UPI000A3A558B|nr:MULTISPECIES: hypothetical protein [Streptomyces]MBD3008386.1 hypothetical protein [Streptomyces sp. 5-10]
MRSELVRVVTVYASTVRIGDIVNIGGTESRVDNMFALHGGGKRLILDTSEPFTLGPAVPLFAKRLSIIEITR